MTDTSRKLQSKAALEIRDQGLMGYRQTLALQKELVEQRLSGQISNTVLIVEHPTVITLGARQSANELLAGKDELARQNIEVVQVRRGGGSTAHNPGQLVCYPIINLKSLALGINEYVRTLETIGIELLVEFGVAAQRRKGLPGLWIENKKIASIGVRVHKWITYHGIAINVRNDLGVFNLIVPCGIKDITMTSVLVETGRKVKMAEVKLCLKKLLTKHLTNEHNG